MDKFPTRHLERSQIALRNQLLLLLPCVVLLHGIFFLLLLYLPESPPPQPERMKITFRQGHAKQELALKEGSFMVHQNMTRVREEPFKEAPKTQMSLQQTTNRKSMTAPIEKEKKREPLAKGKNKEELPKRGTTSSLSSPEKKGKPTIRRELVAKAERQLNETHTLPSAPARTSGGAPQTHTPQTAPLGSSTSDEFTTILLSENHDLIPLEDRPSSSWSSPSLAHQLQNALQLPSTGSVTLSLEISPEGKISLLKVIETHSTLNQRYLEEKLPKLRLQLPPDMPSKLTLTFTARPNHPS